MADKAKILGLLARMALVAIHPDLDEGYDWKTAASSGVDPHSPKIDAMTKRVLTNRTCGHIVFVDNVAAHRWVVQTLVKAGIPEGRIAVLNAEVAQAAADRQRIAREFNGEPEEGIAPKFDVVIANAIAYEGIDLQTRTCAIHHLDLPWEPATLQQRNGRGVRQGNTLANIEINYYFARRSQDGLRFNLIQGKLGWMTELLKSQARDTNNPGAQMDLGPEDILLLISRDPEKTARRLAEVKARREAEAKKKVAEDAARILRSANARFRKAERTEDPTEAARLRLEGEERLKDLANVDPSAWPWARWMYAVRDHDLLVPQDGEAPGLRGPARRRPEPVEPGQGAARRVRARARHGDRRARGGHRDVDRAGRGQGRRVQARARAPRPGVARDEEQESGPGHRARIDQALRYGGNWTALGWTWASDAWMERTWARHGAADRAAARGGVELVRGAAAGAGGRARGRCGWCGACSSARRRVRRAADAGGVAAVPRRSRRRRG
jgi:superfamily II DNA/RNA helicase